MPVLATNQFRSGAGLTSTENTTQRFIYNTTTGALYFDRDGVGGVPSVQIANLLGAPVIATADIIWDFA